MYINFDDKDITESEIQVDSAVFVKEIFITIYDLNKLDKYLLDLHKKGFDDYFYRDYRVSGLENLTNESRKKAISSAKRKAVLLAQELGQTKGKAHLIEEILAENNNWYSLNSEINTEKLLFSFGSEGYLIDPGYVTIQSKLKVSFELIK